MWRRWCGHYGSRDRRLVVPEPEAVAAMVYLATDAWTEERMAAWLREHLVPAG